MSRIRIPQYITNRPRAPIPDPKPEYELTMDEFRAKSRDGIHQLSLVDKEDRRTIAMVLRLLQPLEHMWQDKPQCTFDDWDRLEYEVYRRTGRLLPVGLKKTKRTPECLRVLNAAKERLRGSFNQAIKTCRSRKDIFRLTCDLFENSAMFNNDVYLLPSIHEYVIDKIEKRETHLRKYCSWGGVEEDDQECYLVPSEYDSVNSASNGVQSSAPATEVLQQNGNGLKAADTVTTSKMNLKRGAPEDPEGTLQPPCTKIRLEKALVDDSARLNTTTTPAVAKTEGAKLDDKRPRYRLRHVKVPADDFVCLSTTTTPGAEDYMVEELIESDPEPDQVLRKEQITEATNSTICNGKAPVDDLLRLNPTTTTATNDCGKVEMSKLLKVSESVKVNASESEPVKVNASESEPVKVSESEPVKVKVSKPVNVSEPMKVNASEPEPVKVKVSESEPVKVEVSKPVKVEASQPVKVEVSEPVKVEPAKTTQRKQQTEAKTVRADYGVNAQNFETILKLHEQELIRLKVKYQANQ